MRTTTFNAEDHSMTFQQTWIVEGEELLQQCPGIFVRDTDCHFKLRFADKDARRKELRADITICEPEASSIIDREGATCKRLVISEDNEFETAAIKDKSVETMFGQLCDGELLCKQVDDMSNVTEQNRILKFEEGDNEIRSIICQLVSMSNFVTRRTRRSLWIKVCIAANSRYGHQRRHPVDREEQYATHSVHCF